ncbi:uncharacterized protein NEMAJ01_2319 [Nematocida major]|uniref:uncharacterized protein n=1 Tax=Nematocida major TaxID=1912982 RepID=UPI002008978A|nr:uncharacterized protein NEMAJ01_2319 [Nematocida major]KAH9387423.1 hypothetical protein NEMAJ01_2319 [Nematocida major]
MNICFFFWVLFMQALQGQEIEKLSEALDIQQKMGFFFDDEIMKLRHSWIGSPASLHMLKYLGYAQRLRNYSPGICIDFSSAKTRPNNPNNPILAEFLRGISASIPSLDRAYPPEDPNNPKDLNRFYTVFLQMFPREETFGWKKPFFLVFLEKACSEQEASCFLASLFLLSEGVDVPIQEKDGNIFLPFEGNELIRLNVSILGNANLKMDRNSLKILSQIIDFFKTFPFQSLPNAFSEFEKGKFLESKNFLIAAFMGEYAKSACFLETFYNQIFSLITAIRNTQTNNRNKIDALSRTYFAYSRIFTPFGIPEEIFSAQISSLINVHASIKAWKNEKLLNQGSFQISPEKKFGSSENGCTNPEVIYALNSDKDDPLFYAEMGLYTLLITLSYNAEKETYDFSNILKSRMQGTSEESKNDFFVFYSFFSEIKKEAEKCKAYGNNPVNLLKTFVHYPYRIPYLKSCLMSKEYKGSADLLPVLEKVLGICGVPGNSGESENHRMESTIRSLLLPFLVDENATISVEVFPSDFSSGSSSGSLSGINIKILHSPPIRKKEIFTNIFFLDNSQTRIGQKVSITPFSLEEKVTLLSHIQALKKIQAFFSFLVLKCVEKAKNDTVYDPEEVANSFIYTLKEAVYRQPVEMPRLFLLDFASKKDIVQALTIYIFMRETGNASEITPVLRFIKNFIGHETEKSGADTNTNEKIWKTLIPDLHILSEYLKNPRGLWFGFFLRSLDLPRYVQIFSSLGGPGFLLENFVMHFFRYYRFFSGYPIKCCKYLKSSGCLKVLLGVVFPRDSPENALEICHLILSESERDSYSENLVNFLCHSWIALLLLEDDFEKKHKNSIALILQYIRTDRPCFLNSRDFSAEFAPECGGFLILHLERIKDELVKRCGIEKYALLENVYMFLLAQTAQCATIYPSMHKNYYTACAKSQ